MSFDIRGDHLAIKSIQLNGDAMNLSGQGELRLDGQTNPINLQLYTKVLRGNVPIVSSIVKRGEPADHDDPRRRHARPPEARAEAFPVANQALQQLQSGDAEPSSSTASRFTWPFTSRR